MSLICGNTGNLKQSQIAYLDNLGRAKSPRHLLLGSDLLLKAVEAVLALGESLGVLVDRQGKVFSVILSSGNHIYLPDLGRFRSGKSRLRGLRLLVFKPEHLILKKNFNNKEGNYIINSTGTNQPDNFSSPEIDADFITDLIKLRLDAVAVVEIKASGSAGSASLAFLAPKAVSKRKPFGEGFEVDSAFSHFQNIENANFDFLEFIEDLETGFERSNVVTHKVEAEKAILIGAYTGSAEQLQSSVEEMKELARTAGLTVVDTVSQRRKKINPKSIVGKGKLEEIVLKALDLDADLLVFDRELSPAQLNYLTANTELRVIDRSMLILDIFAQRATTSEGRLQVELAQLRYSLPRLSQAASGLSRLTGGIGGRGPGETKLEIGRRRARDRIAMIEKKLSQVSKRRAVQRGRRQRRGLPVVAIVGYTNAGKSTLLNSITASNTFVENKLFATLDTSSRRMRFPNEQEVIFVDTVGFIRELPKELINAFRATLEEIGEADLLIHVVDASGNQVLRQIEVVEKTLDEIGYGNKPRILALNKIDKVSRLELRVLEKRCHCLSISAKERRGFRELIYAIQNVLANNFSGIDPGSFISSPQV